VAGPQERHHLDEAPFWRGLPSRVVIFPIARTFALCLACVFYRPLHRVPLHRFLSVSSGDELNSVSLGILLRLSLFVFPFVPFPVPPHPGTRFFTSSLCFSGRPYFEYFAAYGPSPFPFVCSSDHLNCLGADFLLRSFSFSFLPEMTVIPLFGIPSSRTSSSPQTWGSPTLPALPSMRSFCPALSARPTLGCDFWCLWKARSLLFVSSIIFFFFSPPRVDSLTFSSCRPPRESFIYFVLCTLSSLFNSLQHMTSVSFSFLLPIPFLFCPLDHIHSRSRP